MNAKHIVVWLDHATAKLLPLVAASNDAPAPAAAATTIHAQVHHTAQHGSGVRDQHEYYAAVCDGLGDGTLALVTGAHTSLADLRRYVEKHRPHLVARIIGYEVVDHPTDNQLVAQARTSFAKYERMAGGSRVS